MTFRPRKRHNCIRHVIERIYARDAKRSEEWELKKDTFKCEVKEQLTSLTELCITEKDKIHHPVRYKDFIRRLHVVR